MSTATVDVRDSQIPWHGMSADDACAQLAVDRLSGLDAAEVDGRRAEHGPNKLAEAEKEPGWHAFLRQYRDLMQLVLLGAALISIIALQEFSTGLFIIGITVLNAMLGLNQEGKAAESVAALHKMLLIHAHARREGQRVDVEAEELVPGDIVTFEAGDKIPADGAAPRRRDARDRGSRPHRREHAGARSRSTPSTGEMSRSATASTWPT